MNLQRFSLLSVMSLAAMDPNGGCDACDPTPTPPGKIAYSAPVAVSNALRAADDAAFAAHEATQQELKKGIVHRDIAARNVLISGSANFLHMHARVLADSHGGGSDEQQLIVLLETAFLLERSLDGLAADVTDTLVVQMLTAQRELVEKERQALAAVLEAGTAPTAKHELTHVVQQQTGVQHRTRRIGMRLWVEDGAIARLDVNCTTPETEVTLVDTANAVVVKDRTRGGSVTLNSQTSSTRMAFSVLLGQSEEGTCEVKLTAPVDLRSTPAVLTQTETAAQAIAKVRKDNVDLRTMLGSDARKEISALLTVADLIEASSAELADAIAANRAVPLEDAQLAAAANGALASAALVEAIAFAQGDAELSAQLSILKHSHDMQMGAIRNLK